MKLLFIPNWNGHLYLQEYEDKSVSKLYTGLDYKNKKLISIEKNNITKTNKIIQEEFSKELRKENKGIISITGDHSNSYSLIKSFSKKNKDFKLVIFDAHPDVEKTSDLVSHEDYLRNLIEGGVVKPENIYLFGIRTFSRVEFDYLIEKKVNFWTIVDLLKDKNKISRILKELTGELYLSIDIDVLDPDFAPGTYYKEWCGLNLNELMEFISILKDKVSAIDICEYYIENDTDEITFKNVLRLINLFLK